MVIEGQVRASPNRSHVPRRTARHSDAVHEPRFEAKARQQIVLPSQGDAVMPGRLAGLFNRPRRGDVDAVDRIVGPADDDAAVGVVDADVADPAMPDATQVHRVETHLAEVPLVERVGKREAQLLDATFLDAALRRDQLRLPFRSNVCPQRPIEADSFGGFIHLRHPKDKGRANALQVRDGPRVVGLRVLDEAFVRYVAQTEFVFSARLECLAIGHRQRLSASFGRGGNVRKFLVVRAADNTHEPAGPRVI